MIPFVAGVIFTCINSVPINLDRIIQIESTGNAKAFNSSSRARGIFQITPIVLQDWNNLHKKQYGLEDLFKKEVSLKIAIWYLQDSIPILLSKKNQPVTLRNVLVAWNAGIKYVNPQRRIPKETEKFLEKYNAYSPKL